MPIEVDIIPDEDFAKLKSLARAVKGGTLDPLRLACRAYQIGSEAHAAQQQPFNPSTLNMDELEKETMRKAIEKAGGSLLIAAGYMGIGKTTIYRKAKAFGLVQS